MNLAIDLLRHVEDQLLSPSERALARCKLAKELEEAGNYEAAQGAMGDLWPVFGERPQKKGLDDPAYAEVLLRAGSLTGWIGSAKQKPGVQDQAKDLISEAISLFSGLGDDKKVAEAENEIAWCYVRQGAYDEARILLQVALDKIPITESELRANVLLRLGIVERTTNRLQDALELFTEHAALFESTNNHSLLGKFHNTLGLVYRNLACSERAPEFNDYALIEYTAASFHFDQAGHTSYRARVENNLGFLHFSSGRFNEASSHLELARKLFISLKDSGSVAQVDETRARVLLAEGKHAKAERVSRAAVHTLEKGGEQPQLAEALTTYGTALARLGKYESARIAIERAVTVAEIAGDREGAGRSTLTLIEELTSQLGKEELVDFYELADQFLIDSEHQETLGRLRRCARLALAAQNPQPTNGTETFFIHASARTVEILKYARRVAASDSALLLLGETGVGKEVLARQIHEWSGRTGRFIALNCATLTDTLVESQLFGHRRGSFTGADYDHPGAAREATGGTLFLDEVGDLSPANQAKLLRLVESKELATLGASKIEKVDTRVLAATNHDLREDVNSGRFRADLFFRLASFEITIPPLRERLKDIPVLARHFIKEARSRYRKRVNFTEEAIEAMRELPLPGNARELRHIIERTILSADEGAEINAEQVQTVALRQKAEAAFNTPWQGFDLTEEVLMYERSLIERGLKECRGSVTVAARLLGVSHQTLTAMLNTRHQVLLQARTPPVTRRRSIIKIPQRKKSRLRKSQNS